MASNGTRNGEGKDGDSKAVNGTLALAPPLVPINNIWLSDLSARIRSRPIPWEGYARAELVSQDELRMIRSVDDAGHQQGSSSSSTSSGPSKTDELLDKQGDNYAMLFIRLLAKLTRTDTLQQVLVLVSDMLEGRDDRAKLFLKVRGDGDEKNAWPWAPLIKLLDVKDDFSQLKAAQFLTLLLVSDSSVDPPADVLPRLLSLLSSLVNSGAPQASLAAMVPGAGVLSPPQAQGGFAEGNGADVAIQLLEALLRNTKYRTLVWDEEMRKLSETSKDDTESSGGETMSIIVGLRSILRASATPTSRGASGTSTPNAGAPSFTSSSSGNGSTTAGGTNNGSSTQSSATLVTAAAGSRGGPSSMGGGVGVQMVYQVVFCIWLLSFDDNIASQLNVKFGLVALLADVARNAIKEKVVRVIVATLRNLVVKAPSVNAPALLGSRGLALMESLASRKWSDEEIPEDVEAVRSVLADKLKGMSTYDEYISELASGQLTWDNPAHKLDDFWKDNATKLINDTESGADDDHKDQGGFKLLVKVLMESDEAQSLALACNDITKVVNFAEGGKKRVEEAGAKARIMELMSHPNADVQYRALNAVSRLVSGSWRG